MFFSISSHGQWSVGDVICLVLDGFKDHRGRSIPVLAFYDRSDGALLVCGVEHLQGLSARATDWAYKIHHLEIRGQHYTTGSAQETKCMKT